jgi:hypothetical protein
MPSLPATTHEAEHMLHNSRSLPSFVHPHRAAAAESIASGFEVYVEGLKVASLSRNACVDDGEKSLVDVEAVSEEEENGSLNGMAFRVLAAVFARIALKCGALDIDSGFTDLYTDKGQYGLLHYEENSPRRAVRSILPGDAILGQGRVYGTRRVLPFRTTFTIFRGRPHSLV